MVSAIVKNAKQAKEISEQVASNHTDVELQKVLAEITRYAKNGHRSMKSYKLTKPIFDQLETLGFDVVLHTSVDGDYLKISW